VYFGSESHGPSYIRIIKGLLNIIFMMIVVLFMFPLINNAHFYQITNMFIL
jgi:hypothetical protein